uniref:RING-type E3 ubiquitin transferase n=1 Tax=Calidris pygmaea TaxID=425635 RepID=A0A8C3J6D3_9CHAR
RNLHGFGGGTGFCTCCGSGPLTGDPSGSPHASLLPLLSSACFALMFPERLKLRQSVHLSWQVMASDTKEGPEQSSSAVRVAPNPMQQAGQSEAVADAPCSICMGTMHNTVCVPICFHRFCFGCIWRWASRSPTCPLCRQPFDHVLHIVRADSYYQEYAISPSARQWRSMARNRLLHRSPQQRYDLRRRLTNDSSNCLLSHPLSLLERRAFHSFSAQHQNLFLVHGHHMPDVVGQQQSHLGCGDARVSFLRSWSTRDHRERSAIQCCNGCLPVRELSQNCGIYTAFFSTGSLLSTKT